jgi:hypothetical protein
MSKKRNPDDIADMLERAQRITRQVQERSTQALKAGWPAAKAEIVKEHAREVNAAKSAQAAQRRATARAEFKASGSGSKKQWAADNHARYGVAFRTLRDWLDGC